MGGAAVIVLAIDPAKPKSKRGYAHFDGAQFRIPHVAFSEGLKKGRLGSSRAEERGGGQACFDGSNFASGPLDWAVVEGQWVNAQASKQALMTLSFYAGFLLGSSGAPRFACIPVAVWKGALFGSAFANVPKAVFCANIRQLLERRGLPVPESEHDLDAAGLALACFSGKFELEDYEIR